MILRQMPGLYWTTDQNLRITSNWGKGLVASNIPPDALVGHSVCEFLGCADRRTTPLRNITRPCFRRSAQCPRNFSILPNSVCMSSRYFFVFSMSCA
jgi:hypothetical protein